MPTLHGKKITDKQYSALQKKWEKENKAYFKKTIKEEIERLKKNLSSWKARKAEYQKKKASQSAISFCERQIEKTEALFKEAKSKLKSL